MRKVIIYLCVLWGTAFFAWAHAADADKINSDARQTLSRLYEDSPSTKSVIDRAAGVLVFPHIFKGGVGIGAEYGEGVLLERNVATGYYNIASGSIGFQLGGQKFSQVIAFMTPTVLNEFKSSEGWKVGVDGSIVIAKSGTSGEIDSEMLNNPIIAFILGERGLMYNATLEGSKITRIQK